MSDSPWMFQARNVSRSCSSSAVVVERDGLVKCHQHSHDCDLNYDCHELAGMRVLLWDLHMEGNLGDELETTVLLKELKRCQIYTIGILSQWINHPTRLDVHSLREHALIDEFISIPNTKWYFPMRTKLPTNLHYDATIYAPGPQHPDQNGGNKKNQVIPIDIFFGGSIMFGNSGSDHKSMDEIYNRWTKRISPNLRLAVVREPLSFEWLQRLEGISNETNHTTSDKLYMMGDLANAFEPAWSAVKYWQRYYNKKYDKKKIQDDDNFNINSKSKSKSKSKKQLTLIFSRSKNIFEVLKSTNTHQADNTSTITDNNAPTSITNSTTIIQLQTNPSKTHPMDTVSIASDEILVISTSAVEDGETWNQFRRGIRNIPGILGRQYIVLETIEQLFALILQADRIYTDRYHPGVVGYRFGKPVQTLRFSTENSKLLGLMQLIEDYPDPHVIPNERIPQAFQKLRDTLRTIRHERTGT